MRDRLRRNDVPPVGGMLLLPCGRNDAIFALCACGTYHVPEGDASLAKPTSLGRADIICPTGQTSLKKAVAFEIAFFLSMDYKKDIYTSF